MRLKKHFITGLVVFLPIALTFWIVAFAVDLLTNPFLEFAEKLLQTFGLDQVSFLFLSSAQVLVYSSRILILLFLFGLILLIGMVGRHFFFKYFIKLGDTILHRIPVISTVYKTSQELIQNVLSSTNKSFQQVVLVPFPHNSSWTIGLVTKDESIVAGRTAVFIPTTPNPTSGYLVMYKTEEITPLDMRVEEALRYIISCGVLLPPIQKTAKEVEEIIKEHKEP